MFSLEDAAVALPIVKTEADTDFQADLHTLSHSHKVDSLSLFYRFKLYRQIVWMFFSRLSLSMLFSYFFTPLIVYGNLTLIFFPIGNVPRPCSDRRGVGSQQFSTH